MNRYTNIRYHIYKELSKYRGLQEKRRVDRIYDFSIPIITGIIVVLVTNWFKETGYLCYWGGIVVVIVGYYPLLLIIKSLFNCWENKIVPNFYPIIKIQQNDKEFSSVQEEDAAKFNYEVTYLVESAYSQVRKIDVSDELLFRFSLLNVLFCTKNALRKMSESLLGRSGKIDNGLISYSKIEVVLEMIGSILSCIRLYDENKIERYCEEIEFVKGLYNDTKRQIELEYGVVGEQSY